MDKARLEWSVPLIPTDEELANPSAYLRSVVRVFPDYADSVLWFVGGPVAYTEAELTDSLVTDMTAWEISYYAGIGEDLEWRSSDLKTHHYREGLRLARSLSDELGDAFEVEVFALGRNREEHKIRLRGQRQGSNSRAIAAFQERVARDEARHARIDKLKANGSTLGWRGYVPLKNNES
jgi:hypothetical protein